MRRLCSIVVPLSIAALATAHARTRFNPDDWYDIGSVISISRAQLKSYIGKRHSRVLRLGWTIDTSQRPAGGLGFPGSSTSILARRGHVWEGRQLLQACAAKHHLRVQLADPPLPNHVRDFD